MTTIGSLPYEQAVDTLSTFQTYKELYDFIGSNDELLDTRLLDELELRSFQTDNEGQQRFYKGLAREIQQLLCRKTLLTFVNMDADKARPFFYKHYRQLAHRAAYDFFPEIKAQVSDENLQALISIKELMLTQLIAEHFLFDGDRHCRYFVLLNGLVWLNEQAARDCFSRAAAIDDQWRQRVAQLSGMVAQCTADGPAECLYNYDLVNILNLTSKASGEEGVQLSRTLLEIVGDSKPELSALSYANIGNNLRISNIRGDKQRFWNAVFAYRQALKLYTSLDDAEGIAQSHRNLAELFLETTLGDGTENIMLAIASFEQALIFFTQAAHPSTYARINYHLGDLYRDLKTEAYAENIESCIAAYHNALQYYTLQENPEAYGDIQNSLGTVYLERIREHPIENVELAITAILKARGLIDPVREPSKWAITANNLGKAFMLKTKGNKADNQDEAIAYYKEALAVPEEPASRSVAMQNLGCLFRDRITGDKNDNLEWAKYYLEQALEIRVEEQFPIERGNTLINLGAVMLERLKDNRIENVEQALVYETQAGVLFLREKQPIAWALTQRNLASIYRERLRGDRAENIERSLEAAENALTVYTVERFPKYWGELQQNIALSCYKRLRGDKMQNMAAAITAIENALTVFDRALYPEEWANCLHIKGSILMDTHAGDRSDNIEAALEAFGLAALFYKEAGENMKWAKVEHDAGIAYHLRQKGDKHDNLEAAIKAYEHVISVFDKDYFREILSNVYNILGSIYSRRTEGRIEDNIKAAVSYYRQSLAMRTLEEFPQHRRDTAWNFGNFLYRQERWEETIEVFLIAHKAIQATRNESRNIESLGRIAKENAEMYRKLVTCCLNIGAVEEAATYALLGKARTLAELQGDHKALAELKANDPVLAAGFLNLESRQALLNEALSLLQYERESGRLSPEELVAFDRQQMEAISRLRHEINLAYDELLFKHPELSAFRPLPDFSIHDLYLFLDAWNKITLIEYVQHDMGYVAFVFRDHKVMRIDLSEKLMQLLEGSVVSIVEDKFWRQPSQGYTGRLRQMYDLLVGPLEHLLPADGPVMVAPTTFLHLLPFQAFTNADGQYLSERFAITFVPGTVAILALAERTRKNALMHPPGSRLLTVAHSGYGDKRLEHVMGEVEAICQWFDQVAQLHAEEATTERIISLTGSTLFDVVHFSCHGYYNIGEPGLSGLIVADGNILTVNEIRTKLRLGGNPLVSLSACQTGQIKPEFGDESIGIAWSFLTAGASVVLASQWSVPDEDTRALFESFYWYKKQTGGSNAECLQQAITEIRNGYGGVLPFAWAGFHTVGLPL